jgi:hypothetical protein
VTQVGVGRNAIVRAGPLVRLCEYF